MARLLKCQEELAKTDGVSREDVKPFLVLFLCKMLEITESDLSPDEDRDIDYFINDWKW